MFRIAACLALMATTAAAESFDQVKDKARFLDLLEGRALHMGAFRIALEVLPDGEIKGEALGWPVSGRWVWQEGYFCRELDWSGKPIPWNCQLVEARGDSMRFTVDQGAGRSALFRLR